MTLNTKSFIKDLRLGKRKHSFIMIKSFKGPTFVSGGWSVSISYFTTNRKENQWAIKLSFTKSVSLLGLVIQDGHHHKK
jgi:hypothetical protein